MKSTAVITTILIILTSATAISALDPPDLLSATALSDSSVELVWRNIDTASTGFYILRKNPGSTQFNVTDSAEANDTSHIDSSLDAGTEYSFALQAFTASLVSDTSNNLSVKTLSIGDLFRAPSIDSLTWGFDSNTIAIEFYDSSNCEHGFYLQRSENFGPYEIIDSLVSTTPGYMGTVIWMDKNLNKNTWYSYIIEAIKYGGTDSLISNDFKIYTFHTETTLNALRNIYLTEKVSEFPIEYKGWAMHVGDTILLTETHAPDSGYTKISIADKKNPAILGYQKAADTIITSFDREDFSGFKPIRRFNYATRTNKLLARSRFGGVVKTSQVR